MKVICVNAKKNHHDSNGDLLREGKSYTVLYDGPCYDILSPTGYSEGYGLAEFGRGIGFVKSRFIPLSDIDETELVQHRELEKVRELCGDRSSR